MNHKAISCLFEPVCCYLYGKLIYNYSDMSVEGMDEKYQNLTDVSSNDKQCSLFSGQITEAFVWPHYVATLQAEWVLVSEQNVTLVTLHTTIAAQHLQAE